jgi:FG-GAP-like repeat/EF hand
MNFPRSSIFAATLVLSVRPLVGVEFDRHAHPLSQGIFGVEALDANGDGRRDLIAAGDAKVWAVLAPDWSQIVELAETPGGRTIHAIALDADKDGDLDLALGRSASDWIAHRQRVAESKPSAEPAGADWTVAWIENTGRTDAPWPLHRLDRELHGVHGVWRGDVNGDGQLDLLANSFAGPHLESSLAWFPAPFPKDAPVGSLRRMITTGQATGRPHYMDFADLDRDGRGDVLLGATAEGSFTWWRQPADLAQEWTRQLIAMEPGGSHPRAADLDGDGQLDVFGSTGHGQGVYWYAAPAWTRHIIDADLRDVHAFDTADLDGDGDIDAAGCSFSAKIVRWWENLGAGKFQPHDLDTTNEQQAYDLKIADLDGDGRLDILLAGRAAKNVVWYRQRPVR